MATRVVSLLRFYGKSVIALRRAVAELAKGRLRVRTQELIWGKDHISWILHMTSAEMLRFLTQKLKSQSINEVQPFPGQVSVAFYKLCTPITPIVVNELVRLVATRTLIRLLLRVCGTFLMSTYFM